MEVSKKLTNLLFRVCQQPGIFAKQLHTAIDFLMVSLLQLVQQSDLVIIHTGVAKLRDQLCHNGQGAVFQVALLARSLSLEGFFHPTAGEQGENILHAADVYESRTGSAVLQYSVVDRVDGAARGVLLLLQTAGQQFESLARQEFVLVVAGLQRGAQAEEQVLHTFLKHINAHQTRKNKYNFRNQKRSIIWQ